MSRYVDIGFILNETDEFGYENGVLCLGRKEWRMSDRVQIIRKEIERLCENCERPTEEETKEKALELVAFGFSVGLTADRPQGWIPCSERMPKKEKATYLICTEGGYMCSCRWTNDMCGLGSNEWSEWGWHVMDKPQYAKVVAWMEMEPWKGADDDL